MIVKFRGANKSGNNFIGAMESLQQLAAASKPIGDVGAGFRLNARLNPRPAESCSGKSFPAC
jgi:hypothetical protein